MSEAIATQSTIFFGWTLAELEALLVKVKAQIMAGGLDFVQSASVGGKTVASGQRIPLLALQRHLKQALRELDPQTYGKRRGRNLQAIVGWHLSK